MTGDEELALAVAMSVTGHEPAPSHNAAFAQSQSDRPASTGSILVLTLSGHNVLCQLQKG